MSDVLAECRAAWPWATWRAIHGGGATCDVDGHGVVVWRQYVSTHAEHEGTGCRCYAEDVPGALATLLAAVRARRDAAAGLLAAAQAGGL